MDILFLVFPWGSGIPIKVEINEVLAWEYVSSFALFSL